METPPVVALSNRDIYSVSRLNREAKALLEGGFPALWIEGELSNLARPGSGHLYFCLKDGQSQIRCALFRGHSARLSLALRDGMRVVVRARVSLYEGRGEFQLLVEHVEDSGEGALRRAFEALKLRLAQAGLFDAARKKPLPTFPRRIGIVTSPTGAAVRDLITTLARRFPALQVLIYPVPVQGTGAAEKIARAITLAGERRECDVLIVARGGGSLEDLWAFNEEVVAQALFACPIPTVSGVGHETDVTIADLVADVRAPTPTAAAELVSPNQDAWLATFAQYEQRLVKLMQRRVRESTQRIDWLSARIVHPSQRLALARERLIAANKRLQNFPLARLAQARAQFVGLRARLYTLAPRQRLQQLQARAAHSAVRAQLAWRRTLDNRGQRLQRAAQALNALSPLATLARGYAIAQRLDRAPIRSATEVRVGDAINVRLAQGQLDCTVVQTHDD